jgi:mannonate dehydratase
MKLSTMLPVKPDLSWKLNAQIGVKYAITKAAPELSGQLPPWDFESLKSIKGRFDEGGFKLAGLEGDEFDMSRIKLGLPGRDEDLEKYRAMLRNMGRLDIGLLCHNFMAGVGWFRSRVDVPERGGALASGFYIEDVESKPLVIDEATLWDNYAYFLKAVLPAAEDAGVTLALHPDDPPISPLLGYSRIFTSAEAYRNALKLAGGSRAFGFAFCQATFKAMGEDVFKLIDEFGRAGRIAFVHLRDIKGTKERFVETFHDNGPTDMVKCLAAYRDAGVDCLIRHDHCPTMAGETNDNPGYAAIGGVFAVGYIKGIMDSLNIKY